METTFAKSKEFIGHSGQIFSIAFNGDFIYSASSDRFVTRWNIDTEEQDKFAIRFEKSPYSLSLIANNEKLAVGLDNGDLHIFDLEKRLELKFFQQHKSAVFSIIENKSKKQFYSADADGNLAVWNTASLNLQLLLPFACGKIRRLMLNKDETLLFLACQDGFVRIIETEFFNLIDEFYAHNEGVTCFSLIPEKERYMLTGGKDAYLKLWDLETKTCLKSLPAHNFVIYDILFLNLEHFVTISRDKTIKVWNSSTLQVTQKIDFKIGGHKHSVNSILKIDQHNFVTCSDDKTIKYFSEKGLF